MRMRMNVQGVAKKMPRATRLQFTVTPTLTRPKVSSGGDNVGGLDDGAHGADDGGGFHRWQRL